MIVAAWRRLVDVCVDLVYDGSAKLVGFGVVLLAGLPGAGIGWVIGWASGDAETGAGIGFGAAMGVVGLLVFAALFAATLDPRSDSWRRPDRDPDFDSWKQPDQKQHRGAA